MAKVLILLKVFCCSFIWKLFGYFAGFNGLVVHLTMTELHTWSGCAYYRMWYSYPHGLKIILLLPPLCSLYFIISGPVLFKNLIEVISFHFVLKNPHNIIFVKAYIVIPHNFHKLCLWFINKIYWSGFLVGFYDIQCPTWGSHIDG